MTLGSRENPRFSFIYFLFLTTILKTTGNEFSTRKLFKLKIQALFQLGIYHVYGIPYTYKENTHITVK